VLSCLGFAAIAYFFSWWFVLSVWETYPTLMVILTLMLLIMLANNQGRWFLLPWMRWPDPYHIEAGCEECGREIT